MNTVDYERKIMEQLDDVNTYIRKEYNDIIEIKKQADKFIFDLHDKGFINKKQERYLTSFTPKYPVFTALLKFINKIFHFVPSFHK